MGVVVKGVVEKDVVIGGVRLHYAEGPDNGPALVLVPGQSMSWQSYCKVIPLLAARFHVFAVDVRGHGKSAHTPGAYSFARCGQDLVDFLRVVVKAPALCAGNSSGGIIALWAAAQAPELVRAVLAEDPPLFSCTQWPASRDTWVHSFFVHVVKCLAPTDAGPPDLATFFATLTIPSQGKIKLMSFPRPLAGVLGGAIRRRQQRHAGAPVDISWLPLPVRLFVRGLSEYDVDFTRACTDGRFYDVDHAAMLAAVRCPITLIKANSFRHPELGLVGAMGDEDVGRALGAQPAIRVERWPVAHVVHMATPKKYAALVDSLAAHSSDPR